jgi:peptidoglycan/LPS O-acetylase OafA/YrhL
MDRSFSIYLDLVRVCAACLVYLYHSNQRWLTEEKLPLSNYGHSAVVVFFVLSGYVIAYVADVKERDWIRYTSSRVARIFSVVLPAIGITVALDFLGRTQLPGIYGYPFDNFVARIGASLLMLNEVWWISITYFSNVPYWSIAFEFWYYFLFALVGFVPGPKRWVFAAALLLALGPKIALLAPLWCSGVLLYRWRSLRSLSPFCGWIFYLLSSAAIFWIHDAAVISYLNSLVEGLVGRHYYIQMTFAKFFISDYLLGFLVFVNFAGMRSASQSISGILVFLERPVRWLAGYTFTLYILHQPLFLFWGAVLKGDPTSYYFWWKTTVLSGACVLVIGYMTERFRGQIKPGAERFLGYVTSAHKTRLPNG